jgi:uncharacterized damage-inducible protein DinB
MTRDEARQLFAYDSWANRLVFTAAGALPVEQLQAPAASSFPSIDATLAHIVGAEWIWLRRWRGESPAAAPAWVAKPSLPDLKRELAAVEAERASFLAGLSEAEFERAVSYRTLAGQPYSDALGGLIRHVVNHSTYHRGQVATQLRQLGHTPPNTDLITYLRQA